MRFFKVNVEKMARKGDVPGLLGALDSEDPSIWIPAARALAAIGDERAISPLRVKVEYWGPRMNGYCSGPGADALSALVAFNNERVAEQLVSLFSGSWMDNARGPAQDALVSLGEPAVRPVCEQLKPNKNPAFGSQLAMTVLKRIGSPSALPDVKDFVREYIGGREVRNPAVQVGTRGLDDSTCITSAIEYLADQEDPEVADLIADLLTYLTGRFREFAIGGAGRSGISLIATACIAALRRMGATAAAPALEAVVTSPHAEQYERSLAADALESVGATVDWDAPWCLLAKQDWDKLVSLGEPALEQLVAALEESDTCKPAIDAIARIGGARAVGVLTEASHGQDMTARIEAERALERLGQK
ncbi:MAG: hypothetical protein ACXVXN_07445 [Mycobacteriaceae bacterium]